MNHYILLFFTCLFSCAAGAVTGLVIARIEDYYMHKKYYYPKKKTSKKSNMN